MVSSVLIIPHYGKKGKDKGTEKGMKNGTDNEVFPDYLISHNFCKCFDEGFGFWDKFTIYEKIGIRRYSHIPLVDSNNTKSLMWDILKQSQDKKIQKRRRKQP